MDAREDPAVAPFVRIARTKRAAQHLPLRLQLQQRRLDRRGIERESRREFITGHRSARLEPAANEFGRRRLARLGMYERRGDGVDRWIEHAVRVDLCEQCEPLRADPERRVAGPDRRRAAIRAQRFVPRPPGGDRGQRDEREQRVVQFVGVAHDGRRLVGHRLDRRGIEDAHAVRRRAPEQPAHLDRAGAALLEWRIVEIGERVRVEDLVRERGWGRRLDGDGRYRAALQPVEHLFEAVDVHRFVQAVVDRLADEHVVGDADRAGEVFRTGGLVREDGGHEIVGLHADDLRRDFLPPLKRRIVSERVAFQRQRAWKIGAARSAWVSTFSTLAVCRNENTASSGNACWSESEMTMPLSVAAAWSSRLNERRTACAARGPTRG